MLKIINKKNNEKKNIYRSHISKTANPVLINLPTHQKFIKRSKNLFYSPHKNNPQLAYSSTNQFNLSEAHRRAFFLHRNSERHRVIRLPRSTFDLSRFPDPINASKRARNVHLSSILVHEHRYCRTSCIYFSHDSVHSLLFPSAFID